VTTTMTRKELGRSARAPRRRRRTRSLVTKNLRMRMLG
jgi:hypothetical protein